VYLPHVSDPASPEDRPEAEEPADRSIGRYLASQRRLRGISLDELAARTKIPRRNLERLESGVFDSQADGFVRGFVRTVAEALGLDPREAVMRLVGEPPGGDEDWRHRHVWTLAGLAAVAGLLLVLLGLGLRFATRWVVEPSGGEPEVVYRRDAVRSLADRPYEEAVRADPAEGAPADSGADEH
jgi:hypothetical protein